MTSEDNAARAWLVRAGKFGERDHWVLAHAVAGTGFGGIGDLTSSNSREAVREVVAAILPDRKPKAVIHIAGQMWALRARIEVGDVVVLPLKGEPRLALGRVTGPYEYLADDPDPERRHVVQVEWVRTDVPRTAIKQDLLYSLGAFSTVCQMSRNDAAWRLERVLETGSDPGARPSSSTASRAVAPLDAEIDAAADEAHAAPDHERATRDEIINYLREEFDGHAFAQLIGSLLEAEGFRCVVSPPGADGGVDILAGRGLLGLDAPRLVVQVKFQDSPVGAQVIQQLQGAVAATGADQSLLVTWSGLTTPARQALAHQHFRLRVWEADDVIAALFSTYDGLPAATRADLPLKRIWALVREEDGH